LGLIIEDEACFLYMAKMACPISQIIKRRWKSDGWKHEREVYSETDSSLKMED